MRTHWSDRQEYSDHKFRLDCNETIDTYFAEVIRDFLTTLTPDDVTHYPDIKSAYKCLSKITDVPTDQLYIVPGSEQGIKSILHLQQSDTININTPTFKLTEVYSELYRYDIKINRFDYDGEFGLGQERVNGGVYIANPDNPTGYTYSELDVDNMCQCADFVILDLVYENHIDHNILDLVNKHDNLYIVKSFSKMGGAAGLRVGYVCSNKHNINKLYDWRPMFEINSIACKYLAYISEHVDELILSDYRIKYGKQMLQEHLSKKYHVVTCGGNFVIVEHDEKLACKLDKLCYYRTLDICDKKFIRITASSPDITKYIIDEIL